MFRRRFRRRPRRRFGGKGVKRNEPVWIQTAYNVTKAPLVFQRDLFALVGPEDYTPDYLSEPQRLEKATLLRTVGHFLVTPVISVPDPPVQRFTQVTCKGALFIASDREIDDGFNNNPVQYDIQDPATFVSFCRNYSPLQVFWNMFFKHMQDGGVEYGDHWIPPAELGGREWDVNVKRRMKGDEGLWLLLNTVSITAGQGEPEFGHLIDVESRNLLND